MAEAVFAAHSGMRYLVLGAAVVAALAALAGSWRPGAPSGLERVLSIVFASFIDIQVLLGIVLLTQTPFHGALTGHIVLMVAAAVSAHIAAIVARKRAATGGASRMRLRGILITLVFIVAGITALRRPVF